MLIDRTLRTRLNCIIDYPIYVGRVPRGDHALFATEHLYNRHCGGRYVTACSSQFHVTHNVARGGSLSR